MNQENTIEIPKYRLLDPMCIRRQKISELKERIKRLHRNLDTQENRIEIKLLEDNLFLIRANKYSSSFFQFIPSNGLPRKSDKIRLK